MLTPLNAVRAAPVATGNGSQENDQSGKTIDRSNGATPPERQVLTFPWHSNHPKRRVKSGSELIDGNEQIELYDRRDPGVISARRPKRPTVFVERFVKGQFVGIAMRRLAERPSRCVCRAITRGSQSP